MNDCKHVDYKNRKIAIWGAGSYFANNLWRLREDIQIEFLCDKDEKKWGRCFTDQKIMCCSPEVLNGRDDILVVISVRERRVTEEIRKELEAYHLESCHINALIRESCAEKERLAITRYDQETPNHPVEVTQKIKKFISISVPVKRCNLSCQYCYIGHHSGFVDDEAVFPSPAFVRRALSQKRLGGTALLNFCGIGETLLCGELFEIIVALLEEGHYVSVISNALLTRELEKYIRLEETFRSRLFFKCSLHYRELKKKNLLDRFARNVQTLRESGISISVEIVPEDAIETMIPEIMDYSMRNFGALPHVTVPRNERTKDYPILTQHSEEEFQSIWGQFHSKMFEMKMRLRSHIEQYCHAGEYSLLVSLDTGEAGACPFEESFTNIYEDISKPILLKPVGRACKNAYCINSHAYLTLGMIGEMNQISYLDIRDRESSRWTHWVCDEMAAVFQQRICENYDEKQKECADTFFCG